MIWARNPWVGAHKKKRNAIFCKLNYVISDMALSTFCIQMQHLTRNKPK